MLKNQVVSSHIAGMLASQDLRIVIGALQMGSILMKRLPQVFGVHFHREGVLHQIRQLADPDIPLGVSAPKCPSGKSSLLNAEHLTFFLPMHYQHAHSMVLGTSLASPQPGPSTTTTPLSSNMTLSSSSATSPVASPTSNGNILFGTIATSQLKPSLAATMETRSRSDLSTSVVDDSGPAPNVHS